jgi:hypothetical protein
VPVRASLCRMPGERTSGAPEARRLRPDTACKPPSGTDWVHEIKEVGYRLQVRRGKREKPDDH